MGPAPVASVCVNPGNPVDVPVGMPGEPLDAGLCASLGLPVGTTWGANAAQVRNLQMGIASAPMQQQIVSTMPMGMPMQSVMVSGNTSPRHILDHLPLDFPVRGSSALIPELTHQGTQDPSDFKVECFETGSKAVFRHRLFARTEPLKPLN